MEDAIAKMRSDWDSRAREDFRYYIACERRDQPDSEFSGGGLDISARIRRDVRWLPETATPRSRRFLEIGCGVGRLMRHLSQDCGEIHGVDVSGEMIRIGRDRLANIPHARFHVAGDSDLADFANDSFDLVYSFAVFQHIPGNDLIWRYIQEAFRVLKPGGILVAQLNGAPPAAERTDTWIGTWIPAGELASGIRDRGWRLLSLEGADTQYLWFTSQKHTSAPPPARWRRQTFELASIKSPALMATR